MDLLQHEFTTAPAGSYLNNVGQLVEKLRHYRKNVSIDEFKAAMPGLKALEKQLQNFDDTVGQARRNYIEEIMNELEQETETREKLIADIQRFSKTIINTLFHQEFVIDEFSFDLRNREAVNWLEFYGYREERKIDERLNVVKDIFRSVCSKHDVIFIDSTLAE